MASPSPLSSLENAPLNSHSDSSASELHLDLTRKLLLLVGIRVALVTVVLGLLFVRVQLQPPEDHSELGTWQYVLIGFTYVVSLGNIFALKRPGWLLPLAYGQIVLDTVIVSVVVFMTGGVESVFSFAYLFVVLGGATTLYRQGTIVASIFSFVLFGLIYGLQVDNRVTQILPKIGVAGATFSFLSLSFGLILVALLGGVLAEKLRITDRQLAQKSGALLRLEELHAAILRSLPAGLMTVDAEGVIHYANEAAMTILQLSLPELKGRHLNEIVPAMEEAWHRRLEIELDGTGQRHEGTHQRPDESQIRVGFSFAPLNLMPGTGAASIVVFQDVTKIARLEEAVERAERLATVGKFAAGLAHEVRNPLASMCASIDVLKGALQPPEPMQRLMNNVVKEAERLNQLITDFLSLARPRQLSLKPTQLSDLVQDVSMVFAHDQKMKGIELKSDLSPEMQTSVDDKLLRQVLWNLMRNAAEAMSGQEHAQLLLRTYSQEGRAVIEINDNGPGLSPTRLKRVFDPFYTTKEGGTGLGLAISHSIIEAHGGKLEIDSEEGKGTRLCIHLIQDSLQLKLPLREGTLS